MNDETSLGSLADRCPPRMMQEGESSKAYAAFQAYVDLGDARTLPDLVEKWDGSKNSLYSWAKKYRWHERIDAATAEVAAIYRRETEKKAEIVAARIARHRIEIADSQFEIIMLAHSKAKEVLKICRCQRHHDQQRRQDDHHQEQPKRPSWRRHSLVSWRQCRHEPSRPNSQSTQAIPKMRRVKDSTLRWS